MLIRKPHPNMVVICNHNGTWNDEDGNICDGPQAAEVCLIKDQIVINGILYFMLKGYSREDNYLDYHYYLAEDFVDPVIWRSYPEFPRQLNTFSELLLSYISLEMSRSFS